MKKRKFKLPVKLLVRISSGILIFFSLIFLSYSIWKALGNSDFFKIKDIKISNLEDLDLSYLKGKNIFTIDLKEESKFLLDFCPDCSKVRLVKILPHRIFIEFIKRRAVAAVKLYRYFGMDEEAVLFHIDDKEAGNLPLIVGLETKIFGPKSGRKYNIREIQLALDLIDALGKNKTLNNFQLQEINVGNLTDVSIFISPLKQSFISFQVKFTEEDVGRKMIILAGLLRHSKHELDKINYIDLRFKEPAIKFKDAK